MCTFRSIKREKIPLAFPRYPEVVLGDAAMVFNLFIRYNLGNLKPPEQIITNNGGGVSTMGANGFFLLTWIQIRGVACFGLKS